MPEHDDKVVAEHGERHSAPKRAIPALESTNQSGVPMVERRGIGRGHQQGQSLHVLNPKPRSKSAP